MNDHEIYMRMAIEEARIGLHSGEDPFGAVIVRNGDVICKARSMKIYTGNAGDHAETSAIGKATRILQHFDLSGCTLYSSCEPCPMCCGAIINTSISILVIGMNLKTLEILFPEEMNYHQYTAERLVELAGAKTKIISGVLAKEAQDLFRDLHPKFHT